MAEKGQAGKISWNRMGYKFGAEGPFQRVTTIKAKKSTGNALVDWAARMVAENAQEIARSLRDGSLTKEAAVTSLLDPNLAQAHNQKRDAAGDFGTVAHLLLEDIVKGDGLALDLAQTRLAQAAAVAHADQNGKELRHDDQAIRLYIQDLAGDARESFEAKKEAFVHRFWPDAEAMIDLLDKTNIQFHRQEFQVFSRKYNYAGSVDMDITLDGVRLIGDLKTSKGAYSDYSLQVAAYRFAEFIGEEDGTESPLPEWQGAVILHVHDGSAQWLEVPCTEKEFRAFVACKALYDFDRYSPKVLAPWQAGLFADDLFETEAVLV